MAGNHRLPEPESVGFTGYLWFSRFDPNLPPVPLNHPSIRINPIVWLEDTLNNFSVEGVDNECFEVDNGRLRQSRVEFSIRPRRGRGGLVQISEVGRKAPDESIAQKYVVVACVNKLVTIGYNMPTYSSMTIKSIDNQGQYYDVDKYCLMMAQNNRNDLVQGNHMTYAGCSFEAIFDQAMYILGYDWRYANASPTLTTEGYQEKLLGTKKESSGPPSLIVLSRPCRRVAEARESALCTALSYINDICGYMIGDLHFTDFIMRRAQLFNSIFPPSDP